MELEKSRNSLRRVFTKARKVQSTASLSSSSLNRLQYSTKALEKMQDKLVSEVEDELKNLAQDISE